MKLYESIASENVSQIHLRNPVTCPPETTVRAAIKKMRQRRLGCAIVIDDQRRPIGILTESMITRMLVNDPAGITDRVSARMSRQCPSVAITDPVARVIESLQRENTRFLCVIDSQGRVVGLTGQKGLMEYVADHFPQQVLVQRVGSRPMQSREGA